MRRKIWNITAACLLGAVLLAGCGGQNGKTENAAEEAVPVTEALSEEKETEEETPVTETGQGGIDSEMEEDLEPMESEFEEYIGSLEEMTVFSVNGQEYASGMTLSAFLEQGWTIDSIDFGEVEKADPAASLAPRKTAGLELTDGSGSRMEVDIMNGQPDGDAALSDCMVTSVSADSSLGQKVKSFSVNGVSVWGQPKTGLEFGTDVTQGENGILMYYFSLGEVKEPSEEVTLTGWSLMVRNEDGSGTVDWFTFCADLIYY